MCKFNLSIVIKLIIGIKITFIYFADAFKNKFRSQIFYLLVSNLSSKWKKAKQMGFIEFKNELDKWIIAFRISC